MNLSDYDNFLKRKSFVDEACGFDCDDPHPDLFPFQRMLVRWALKKGRAAIFADTGLGKTYMQVAWAHRVAEHTGGRVIILAPLAVASQTVEQAAQMGIQIEYTRDMAADCPIVITNYEMMDRIEFSRFSGVALDESSILKSHTGKTRNALIESTREIPYRLSCTATPSPNDFMELGNQAEFIGVMSRTEMLAMFFTHDGGKTSKWRLKGHGKQKFFDWLSTWAAVVRKPSDLGFSDEGYNLPPLRFHEHVVEIDSPFEGELFPKVAQTLAEQRKARKASLEERVKACAEVVNQGGIWIVWCYLNEEGEALTKAIDGAVEIRGSDSPEHKERAMIDFAHGKIRVLVTKPSIAGFGMNWQHCHQQAFVGMDHSFEMFYQAARRSWRFGQRNPVDVHIFSSNIEIGVLENIRRKEEQHQALSESMVSRMRELMQERIMGTKMEKADYMRDVADGAGWTLHLGDCVDVAREMEDESIDYTIFSPPFASLYTYSNSDRDMGNCKDSEEFMEHFRFLVRELYRITKPGRLLSFHCMNLPTSKQNHGYIGIQDFRGDLIRAFQSEGWIYHSEVVIWKDPVTAMQRTKALGLLHKQLKKDSAMSRQGIPDYLVTMRKPGDNPEPITHTDESFPVSVWQRYASPVWMDINPSRTLQYRQARENDDERHICPLQLDVIERCIELWSNPGDLVFSPFAGIGSEGYVAIQMGCRFVGVELKRSYFELAKKNLKEAEISQNSLFADEVM